MLSKCIYVVHDVSCFCAHTSGCINDKDNVSLARSFNWGQLGRGSWRPAFGGYIVAVLLLGVGKFLSKKKQKEKNGNVHSLGGVRFGGAEPLCRRASFLGSGLLCPGVFKFEIWPPLLACLQT